MKVNRMPASAGVVLGLLIVGSVAAMPVFAAAASEEGGPVVTRQLQVGRFAEIKLRGAWKLEFTRASEYSVVLTGNQETVAAAEVSSDGDRLAIHLDGSSEDDGGVRIDGSVRVVITAPTLAALTVAGAVDGRIVGLDAAQLTVVTKGASNLVFQDSTIGDLVLETEGAANVNLETSLVENAVLDMAGASQLKINLNGGSLTGRVRGVGNIRYTGDASSVDLDTVALVKVSRG